MIIPCKILAKRLKINFLTLLLFVPMFSFSQTNKVIRNVQAEGTWDVVGEVSPLEAREKALFEAQKNALRKAGVPTDVRSFVFSGIVGNDETYEEYFTQLNAVYIRGKVVLKKEVAFSQYFDNGDMVVKASIVADVLADNKRDPEFAIDVRGFKNSYRSGENLEFTVKAYKDCYLRVFWFENTTTGAGSILYPIDEFNNDILLKANVLYKFPLNSTLENGKPEINYEMTANGSQTEKNVFFIVATKKKIPFVGEVDFNTFFKWYNQINGEERTEITGKYVTIF